MTNISKRPGDDKLFSMNLNQNENKKVFVPNIWFGPLGEKNFQDIYLDSWTRINVDYSNGRLIFKN